MLRGAGTVPGLALGLLIRVLRPLDSLDMLVQVFVCISVPLFCFAWLFVYGIEEKPHLMPYSVYSASAPRSACRPGLLHNNIGIADADTRIAGNYGIIQRPPSFAPKKSKSGEIWGFGDKSVMRGKSQKTLSDQSYVCLLICCSQQRPQ